MLQEVANEEEVHLLSETMANQICKAIMLGNTFYNSYSYYTFDIWAGLVGVGWVDFLWLHAALSPDVAPPKWPYSTRPAQDEPTQTNNSDDDRPH